MKLWDAIQKQDAKKASKPTKVVPKKATLATVQAELQKIEDDGPLVRLIFPCPKGLADRITGYWHKNGLRSKSEAIRVLIEKGLP